MLLTVSDLAVWAQRDVAPDDAWALAVVEAASDVVRAAAQQPTWLKATAPARARQIASHLAARTFKNPDSVQREGNLGPLGGDAVVEELARAMHLTEAEKLELAGLAPAGAAGGGGGFWVQPTTGSEAAEPGDVYLADDSGSDWMIPYLHPDDLPALG